MHTYIKSILKIPGNSYATLVWHIFVELKKNMHPFHVTDLNSNLFHAYGYWAFRHWIVITLDCYLFSSITWCNAYFHIFGFVWCGDGIFDGIFDFNHLILQFWKMRKLMHFGCVVHTVHIHTHSVRYEHRNTRRSLHGFVGDVKIFNQNKWLIHYQIGFCGFIANVLSACLYKCAKSKSYCKQKKIHTAQYIHTPWMNENNFRRNNCHYWWFHNASSLPFHRKSSKYYSNLSLH